VCWEKIRGSDLLDRRAGGDYSVILKKKEEKRGGKKKIQHRERAVQKTPKAEGEGGRRPGGSRWECSGP